VNLANATVPERESAVALPAAASPDAPTRRCLVTGEERPKAELVRFVVGPEEIVVPDVEGRLPGRGLWTLARRDIVDAAVAKRLFARAARGAAASAADLATRVEGLLLRRCVATLGLARRGGQAVSGAEKVRVLIERGNCGALLVAVGASAEGRRQFSVPPSLIAADVLTDVELGGAFGRDSVTYAAFRTGSLASRILVDVARLRGFRE
jgi:uncharacterized protein